LQLGLCALLAVMSSHVFARECEPACNEPRLLHSRNLPVEVEKVVLQRQFEALKSMQLEMLEYSQLGPVKSLRGKTGIVLPADISERREGDSADDIVPLLEAILLAAGTESLSVGHDGVGLGARSRRFTQRIRGLPVFNSFLGLEYDDRSKEVLRVAARFLPNRGLPEKATVTSEWAEKRALEIVSTMKLGCMPGPTTITEGPALGYYLDPRVMDHPRLVWLMRVQPDDENVYLDANTGTLVSRVPLGIPFVPCDKQLTR
jgi:hypothetical protein